MNQKDSKENPLAASAEELSAADLGFVWGGHRGGRGGSGGRGGGGPRGGSPR
jgi:hypothetical protein